MKLKGINRIEQHFEKLVAALVAVVFVAVLCMQFLLQPNRVQVGGGAKVAPEDAFRSAETEAQRKRAEMKDTDVADRLPEQTQLTLAEEWRALREGHVSPRRRLWALGDPIVIEGGAGEALAVGGPVAPLKVPAPTAPVAAAYAATISPLEVVEIEGLSGLIPPEQPFDATWVTIQGQFNGVAVHTSLTTDPDGDGPQRAMPTNWAADFAVLAVQGERQELALDGSWGQPVPLASLPGRPDLLADLEQRVDGREAMRRVVNQASIESDFVQRAPFYATIAGQAWQPPAFLTGDESVEPGTGQMDRLLAQREDIVRRLEAIRQQIEELRGGPGGGGGDPGRRDGGGGREGFGQPDSTSNHDRKIRSLEAQQDRLFQQLDRKEVELRAAGWQPEARDEPKDVVPQWQTAIAEAVRPVLSAPALPIWTHDLTAQPGKTYRYRLRVVTNNPAFGREPSLPEEQHSLAAERTTVGAYSGWTDPVQVPAREYYFVVNANEGDAFGGPQATVELFKLYFGYYRMVKVTAQPGDPLVGVAEIPSDLTFLDMAKLREGARPGLTGRPGVTQPSERQPRGPRGPEGWRDPEQEEWNEGEFGRGQLQAQPVLGELEIEAPDEVSISAPAVLLDVAAGNDGVNQSEAFLRDDAGRIIVRVPLIDLNSLVYKIVQKSAKEGVNQGNVEATRVVEPPRPTERPRPGREEQDPFRPRPGEGGGGGGGSGG